MNKALLMYLCFVIIGFFMFLSYSMIFGGKSGALDFFYTVHLAFDAGLLAGILFRAFVALFESKKIEVEEVIERRPKINPIY